MGKLLLWQDKTSASVYPSMFEPSDWEAKRLRCGQYQRWLRWEYWPGYLLYMPIFFYCLFYLAIRFKGIMTFTAVNPSIEDGGVINESKIDILNLLQQSGHESIPNYFALPKQQTSVDDSYKFIKSMMDENSIHYPCVLKPNAGQRGTGVVVLENDQELKRQLTGMKEDHFIQDYCPGKEISVFYYRYPRKTEGAIYSITLKTLPTVIGDGKSNLRELILKDDRHVCMTEYFFSILNEKLTHIPSQDEEVILNKIGAHCKGAMFNDGTYLATKALTNELDKMMTDQSGLCFGRFDMVVNDFDLLKQGYGFKVIELNGVTSEATHIYDPRYSIFNAWKVLAKQWKVAYEIGAIQIKQGHSSSPILKILSQIFAYRKKVKSYSGLAKQQLES